VCDEGPYAKFIQAFEPIATTGRRRSPAKTTAGDHPDIRNAEPCKPLWYRQEAARFRASGSERGGWTKWGQAGACPLDRSTARTESIVREVEVRLDMKLADRMTELRVWERVWLDHNNYVPVSFVCKERQQSVLVRVVFAEYSYGRHV
jgi:hypothetical protein